MLLLFTSAPMSFFKSSDDVSIAILFILSGADFLSFIISSSTFFISSLICSSRASLLILIFLIALSLESLKILSNDMIDQNKFISHKCKIQDHKKAFELAKDGNLASKVMIDLCN